MQTAPTQDINKEGNKVDKFQELKVLPVQLVITVIAFLGISAITGLGKNEDISSYLLLGVISPSIFPYFYLKNFKSHILLVITYAYWFIITAWLLNGVYVNTLS